MGMNQSGRDWMSEKNVKRLSKQLKVTFPAVSNELFVLHKVSFVTFFRLMSQYQQKIVLAVREW